MGERDREREREREIEESGIKDKKRSHQERHDRFFPHLLSTDFSRTRHHEFRTRYHEYYFRVVLGETVTCLRGHHAKVQWQCAKGSTLRLRV